MKADSPGLNVGIRSTTTGPLAPLPPWWMWALSGFSPMVTLRSEQTFVPGDVDEDGADAVLHARAGDLLRRRSGGP